MMMHQLLTARLMVALNATAVQSPDVHMSTQYVQPVVQRSFKTQVEQVNTHPGVPVKRMVRKKPQILVQAEKSVETLQPKPSRFERKLASASPVTMDPVKTEVLPDQKLSSEIDRVQYWKTLFGPFKKDQAQTDDFETTEKTASLEELQELYQRDLFYESVNLQLRAMQGPEALESIRLAKQQVVPAEKSEPQVSTQVASTTGATSPSVPAAAAYSVVVNTQSHPEQVPPVNTQKTERNTHALTGPSEKTLPENDPRAETEAVQNAPRFIEAFKKDQIEIANVRSEMRTQEAEIDGAVGWELSQALDHMPVLRWKHPLERNVTTPMVSNQVIQDFATFFRVHQDSKSGLVLISIPAGWAVKFSAIGTGPTPDRPAADQPLYFDMEGNYLGRDSMNTGGIVAFPNAVEGLRMVNVSLVPTGGQTGPDLAGAVAFPVFAGTTTYLDFSQPGVRTLEGKVAVKNNPSLGESTSLIKSTINVIGPLALNQKANDAGAFRLENVLTFGNYPIYIDVDSDERNETSEEAVPGYTHRYAVLPSEMHKVSLIRYSREKIQSWKDVLPGGVPDESPIAVGHFSKIVRRYSSGSLIPEVSSNFGESFGRPCPLSDDDHIQAPQHARSITGKSTWYAPALLDDEKRVVGFEMANGIFEMKLLDAQRKSVWSMFAPASPDVVNIVKPWKFRK
jgi:hypothetical protein